MKYKLIEIEKNDNGFITRNLERFNQKNLRLKASNNEEADLNLLRFLVDYIIEENIILKEDATITYGLWSLKLFSDKELLSIHELNADFSDWVTGAKNATYYLELQRIVCKEIGVKSMLPNLNQKIAVDNGTLGGEEVQGIRYDAPPHMSGWYITSDSYNGDINSLNVIDLFSFVPRRRDLIQFLALPVGYSFEVKNGNYDAWAINL
ncbi:hypothetical protein SIO70_17485 [Chitinophaga sancti]|uniref:immunity protein Imm33 domain-containing protein n=1 Tax=Chitinophaga sancti TaxID=1004 RepID=UPI002A755602|nr:hypothetical protein [Chitinophaga sancti]WPQ60136.1 hypothetical protein SIO70_17485 [Chitinophaga sancti]